jgi:hypothetical protein
MALRVLLILGMVVLAVGVWLETWLEVRAKSRAEREWHRVSGEVFGLADSMRPDVKVEQGIEFVPAPADGFYSPASNDRILEMERDEGLRRFHRYEFLIDPVTKRARVAGIGFSPFLLALLGLFYLGLAAAFYHVTSSSLLHNGASLAMSPPGEWVYFQPPPWHEPAVVSARFGAWAALKWGLGAAILIIGLVVQRMSGTGTLLNRVGLGSVALFVASVLSVLALDRATYRIEADSTGLRESTAVEWRITPWAALRGAVDETARESIGRASSARGSSQLYRTTNRVYFTDDQGEEIISIGDDLVTEQCKALLAHVLGRTGLKPEKRVLGKSGGSAR